jgi:hypothetical protein
VLPVRRCHYRSQEIVSILHHGITSFIIQRPTDILHFDKNYIKLVTATRWRTEAVAEHGWLWLVYLTLQDRQTDTMLYWSKRYTKMRERNIYFHRTNLISFFGLVLALQRGCIQKVFSVKILFGFLVPSLQVRPQYPECSDLLNFTTPIVLWRLQNDL